MPPKAPKAFSAKPKDDEQEVPLQAVVLADTFETRFSPLTNERPRCLLPLANTPLIEYTLEFLANAGVQHVFLYGGAHTSRVERYVNESKWKRPSSPFKEFTFLKTLATSVGDVMRDLDQKGLIKGDFLCVPGDVISDFPIENALAKHRARRLADKNAIMTMVLREAGGTHRTKTYSTPPTFVIDPTKDRCLHYEEILYDQDRTHVELDPELLIDNSEIEVRQDLIDCRIDICTPDVLSLWADNFDNQSPRRDFLYQVLKDYELNGKTIHTHIVQHHYAARVSSRKTYDSISKDIISRWTYPLCPDTDLHPSHSYTFKRGNYYQEDGVVLARSCVVDRQTVLGRATSIGDRSRVGNSIVGRRCQIGRNVTIRDSYIWDDATIGDGTEVTSAIIADEAVIESRCKIQPGALVSFGSRVSEGTTFESHEDDMSDVGSLAASLSSDESDNIGDDFAANPSIMTTEERETREEVAPTQSRDQGFFDSDEEKEDEGFYSEAVAGLYERMQEDADPANMQTELTSLRLAYDVSEHDVRKALCIALVKRMYDLMENGAGTPEEATTKVLDRYRRLIERENSREARVDFLLLLQKEVIAHADGGKTLFFIAQGLYEMDDMFEEEDYQAWWDDQRSCVDNDMRQIRRESEKFMDWLANAEEESDEDSN